MMNVLRGCLVVMLVGMAIIASAGGPFVVDSVGMTGVAQNWRDNKITWYSETGNLSNGVTNATAVSWIESAFAKWRDLTVTNADGDAVKTVDLTVRYGGNIGVDIDASNFQDYLSGETGPSVIIFDKDGSILDYLMVDSNSVIGLTAPSVADDTGKIIVRGFSILNGKKLDASPLSTNATTAQTLFQASLFHELGHLLNLDHSQVNEDIARDCSLATGCTNGQYIPTMYPELKTSLQTNPTRDDKIALSAIYPNDTFREDFCAVVGTVNDAAGNPLRGVNVVASRVGDGVTLTRQDARSFISGAMYPECSNDGRYFLSGIVPGKQYQVLYEPLNSEYGGQSGFEPLDNPPMDFDSEVVTGSGGATTVSCTEGGQTIQMPTVSINTTNPCLRFTDIATSSTPGGNGGGGGGEGGGGGGEAPPAASSGGGCSFILGGT
ncbi:MAG: hypothetical protein HY465_00275 [Deltaproteobacteria bacterium]|nr:hypothetical protein [Deltaproteobacteria bacterium]